MAPGKQGPADYILDFQEMIVQKKVNQPKKSPAEGGRLLRLLWGLKYNQLLEVQNMLYTYWVYLMEHIHFEAQLCIKISMFKETSNLWLVINLCLGTSLQGARSFQCIMEMN